MVERRDDVGGKVILGIMSSIIVIFITSFLNIAWSTASDGKKKAEEVEIRQTSLEAKFTSFQSDLTEIKDLLRRNIPNHGSIN